MPIVYSPGEGETRPIDPSAVVYTSAQKVAELLGIGPGEAVLTSANTIANAVFVTGADYREHGFAVGDSILVYSDAFPIGFTSNITSIASGGGNGVQLNVDVTIATTVDLTDLAVADNTYVQNQASFTNGKTRGMKRSTVEQRILEVQDRIDNVTHNAWRPYLVNAEYINFDTYKPYRRRYYTDYVGTVPLLFRNVQQILKLEVWQGDDYREIAGAEVRLEVADYTQLSGDAIYLCPGGGGFAKLGVGTGTQQWNAGFNKVTTAQNLADLINNEDRTNRGTVSFTTDGTSPNGTTYTLPDGSSTTGATSVNLHHEFLASANADYGNGKLKITSMQQTKGGETATIAISDDTNLTLTDSGSQTTVLSRIAQTADFTKGNAAYNNGTTVTLSSGDVTTGLKVGMRVIGDGVQASGFTKSDAAYNDGTTVTLSGSSTTASLLVGMRVTGSGINALVESIPNSTQFVLTSVSSGGEKTGQTLTFSNVYISGTYPSGGSGYSSGTYATSGGSGTGMTVTLSTTPSGGLGALVITNEGSNYENGDVIRILNGSQATFTITVINASGIPDNAVIVSITDSTRFVLSAATTGGSKSGKTLTFSPMSITGTIPSGGSGYSTGTHALQDSQATSGGSGTGMTATITVAELGDTAITRVSIDAGTGNGYVTGDVITIGSETFTLKIVDTTGNITVTNISTLADYGVLSLSSGTSKEVIGYTGKSGSQLTGCVDLHGNVITASAYNTLSTLQTGSATGIQHLFASDIGQYSDAGGDQARLKDWWLDAEMGIIYFNNSYPFFEWNAVKASYIYGERYLEKAIEEAATKLVAADLLMSDDRSVLVPEGSQNVDLGAKIQLYRKEAEEILKRYKEMVVFA